MDSNVTDTFKTLGKLEAEVDHLKNTMKDTSNKLDEILVFLNEARGAKKAVVAMWFVAASIGGALFYFATKLMEYFAKPAGMA